MIQSYTQLLLRSYPYVKIVIPLGAVRKADLSIAAQKLVKWRKGILLTGFYHQMQQQPTSATWRLKTGDNGRKLQIRCRDPDNYKNDLKRIFPSQIILPTSIPSFGFLVYIGTIISF